jgi:hypothetical protein
MRMYIRGMSKIFFLCHNTDLLILFLVPDLEEAREMLLLGWMPSALKLSLGKTERISKDISRCDSRERAFEIFLWDPELSGGKETKENGDRLVYIIQLMRFRGIALQSR